MGTRNCFFLGILALALCSTSSFAAESVRCEETNADDPAVLTIKTEYSLDLPGMIIGLKASINSKSRHLNTDNFVRLSQKRGYAYYKDFMNEKAFTLTIKLDPNSTESLPASLSLDEGSVWAQKIPNLLCSVPKLPPAPSEACMKWSTAKKNTALIRAAKAGTLEQIDALLDCGANPNFHDAKGCTPLLYMTDLACGYRPSGTTTNPANPNGQESPIMSPRSAMNLNDYINLLLSQGAEIDSKDPVTNETPLLKLVKYSQADAAEIFINLEADINAQDVEGNTAIMLAADKGNYYLVRTVLDGNPNLALKNKAGKTAYQIAEKKGYGGLLDLLTPAAKSETIEGKNDGTCTPKMVHLMVGKSVEIVLKSSTKMFLLKAPALNLELMSMPGQPAKQTITPTRTGTFPFTCGVHGAPDDQQTKGSFMVM